METITSTQWMHSCYEMRKDISILTVKEKEVTIDKETQEIISVKSKLKQTIDPERRVYITKPEYRKHRYKKESEDIKNCNSYQVKDRELTDFLKEQMGISKYEYIGKRAICDSPYIYGTDISIEALERYKYECNQQHYITPFVTGALDIETSVIHDDKRINCITVICDKKIYTAALKEFMWVRDPKDPSKDRPADISELYPLVDELIGEYLKPYDVELEAKVFESEADLLTWIFQHIQEDEPDYMLIWNLGFDVPRIMERMEILKMDPTDYFCSPSVPKNKRYLRYYEDPKKVDHIVQKWNWLHATSVTQWLDSLAMFGQVRRQAPKKASYRLDDIMQEVLGFGKVDLGGLSHRDMQMYHFLKYWVYNIFDACLVQFATWKTHDHVTLHALTEHSTLMDFSKQAVMLSNDYHHVLLDQNKVIATVGKNMSSPYDHLLTKIGGAVLPANNVVEMGINCVVEHPNRTTNVLLYVADDDYSSMYPSWKETANISKDTKVATIVGIEGVEVAELISFCSAISDPDENAVFIASRYFNLPGYEDISIHVERELLNIEIEPFPF